MRQVQKTLTPTRRLTMLYITALSTVALLTLLGQVVVQSALQGQSRDALTINIAGRQRMLSQRLSKAALEIAVFSDAKTRQQNVDELRTVAALWQRSQEGLEHGDTTLGLQGNNSATVKHLFATIDPGYRTMLQATKELLALALPDNAAHATAVPASAFMPFIQTILVAQAGFLSGMDHIVSQYQQEAEEHVASLKRTEFILLGLTLLVLLLEALFIFRPATQHLRQTIADLLQANERIARTEVTRKRAERILALNEALLASQKKDSRARIVAFGHYLVQDKDGTSYNVYHREIGEQQIFACECAQYRDNAICPHSLAAGVLHSVSSAQSH